jgi:hypothetical protein
MRAMTFDEVRWTKSPQPFDDAQAVALAWFQWFDDNRDKSPAAWLLARVRKDGNADALSALSALAGHAFRAPQDAFDWAGKEGAAKLAPAEQEAKEGGLFLLNAP